MAGPTGRVKRAIGPLCVRPVDEATYLCTGRTTEGTHPVRRLPAGWLCDCAGWTYGGACAHVDHVIAYVLVALPLRARADEREAARLMNTAWAALSPVRRQTVLLQGSADDEAPVFGHFDEREGWER